MTDRYTIMADIAVLKSIPDVSAAVADALDSLNVGGWIDTRSLTPLTRGYRSVGPAITLEYTAIGGTPAANRENGVGATMSDRELFGHAQPGDVAVIVCPPEPVGAVMGSISAHWASLAGIDGCVVDGAVRDSESIVKTGLPVWSATRVPVAGRYRLTKKSLGEPVTLHGLTVANGDIVVADDDGICVVPPSALAEVTRQCVDGDHLESTLLKTIAASTSVDDLRARLTDVPRDVLAR